MSDTPTTKPSKERDNGQPEVNKKVVAPTELTLTEKQTTRLQESIDYVAKLKAQYEEAVINQVVIVELIADAHDVTLKDNTPVNLNGNKLTVYENE